MSDDEKAEKAKLAAANAKIAKMLAEDEAKAEAEAAKKAAEKAANDEVNVAPKIV